MNISSIGKKVLLVIGHLIGLTIVHELGHLIGLIICGVQIQHFWVPFWAKPLTILPGIKQHPSMHIWVWGFVLDNASLDLLTIFFHVILTPLILEVLYVKLFNLPYKVLIPFSLIFKGNDFWILSESIRTFLFIHWGIVL